MNNNLTLQNLFGPSIAGQLQYRRQRPHGELNAILDATEELLLRHCDILIIANHYMPPAIQEELADAILSAGVAAGDLKAKVRDAMRRGAKS